MNDNTTVSKVTQGHSIELGFLAARVAIAADNVNGRGPLLFNKLLGASGSVEGYAVLRSAMEVVESYLFATKHPAA